MKARPPSGSARCPAMSRASSFVLLAGWLVGCSLYPVPVRGVPTDAPWFALPLGEWLGEDRAEPEAVAACRPPECRPGLVVSVVRISGPDAVVGGGYPVRSTPARPRAARTDIRQAVANEGRLRTPRGGCGLGLRHRARAAGRRAPSRLWGGARAARGRRDETRPGDRGRSGGGRGGRPARRAPTSRCLSR